MRKTWPEKDLLRKFKPRIMFSSGLFQRFSGSLVRKYILEKYINEPHPVMKTEIEILHEVEDLLGRHIMESVPKWGVNMKVARMIITQHILMECADALVRQELNDDEMMDEIFYDICVRDFSPLFGSKHGGTTNTVTHSPKPVLSSHDKPRRQRFTGRCESA